MRRAFSMALAMAFLATMAVSVRADDDKDEKKGKLPDVVWKAVTDRYPKAELLKWKKDKDDGKIEYEVKIKVDGKKRELEIAADGKIKEDKLEDDDD